MPADNILALSLSLAQISIGLHEVGSKYMRASLASQKWTAIFAWVAGERRGDSGIAPVFLPSLTPLPCMVIAFLHAAYVCMAPVLSIAENLQDEVGMRTHYFYIIVDGCVTQDWQRKSVECLGGVLGMAGAVLCWRPLDSPDHRDGRWITPSQPSKVSCRNRNYKHPHCLQSLKKQIVDPIHS